jgi:NADPH:quinone reductase
VLGWWMARTGQPHDVLTWKELPDPKPGPRDLLVEVEHAGMSFADLLLIRGDYQVTLPLPCVPGSEFVGRVVGTGADAGIAVGSRVMGLCRPPHGVYAQYCLADAQSCQVIPEELPGPEATSLIGNYVTAHLALHRRARVQSDEVVLVTGAAGGVGTAAVQVAKAAGARVIAADLGQERAASCADAGAHMAVDVTDRTALTRAVAEFTNGEGVDVVVDLVGGELFEVVRRSMAFEGRIVIVGFTGGSIPQIRVNQLLLRSYGVLGVNALTVLEKYPEIHRQAREAVVELLAHEQISPQVAGVFPLESLPETSAAMAGRQIQGKAVFRAAATKEE